MRFPDSYPPTENLAVVELPSDVVEDIQTLLGYAAGIVFVICVAKVIFVGARMAWDHKHGAGMESPKAAEFLAANIGALLAGGVSVTIATILLSSAYGPQSTTPPQKADIVQEIKNKTKPTEQQEEQQDQENE
ncbi:hypothetical protein MWT96_25525 (plasmid) [Prescottella equi]|uniref:Putative integral membrane protein n=1 Tax=Rhodococcus hoagii TaxID=43767 RepID=Q9ETJ9_RHOHA|nr:hypothetical protein [Prescottella equi]AAG21747.1 unknown [Prescottella equi]ADI50215.1 putative integral membrane protein [Prescottella equi]ARX58944.1 putative integral membrane protein [Prescottella equi]ARX59048.1 putative integral membrane protein [Prescottella equi]ARX59097.1 putative integral membrane protein [Prescottella equi]